MNNKHSLPIQLDDESDGFEEILHFAPRMAPTAVKKESEPRATSSVSAAPSSPADVEVGSVFPTYDRALEAIQSRIALDHPSNRARVSNTHTNKAGRLSSAQVSCGRGNGSCTWRVSVKIAEDGKTCGALDARD